MNMEPRTRHLAKWSGRLRPVPPPKKGLKLAGFRLRPDQIKALRREARRRAEERDVTQADASEIVREAIDAWLELHARGRR